MKLKFYNFLKNETIKTIITYDNNLLNNHIKIPACICLKDYLIQAYFLRSYDFCNIAFLFLNKTHKSSIDKCLQIIKLFCSLSKRQ